MKRLLPAPLLSVALFVLWLLLNRTVGLGHVLLALVLALAIPVFTAGLRPVPVRIRRPGVALRLLLTVAGDSVQSNIAVVRLLLQPGRPTHTPAFVHVALDGAWERRTLVAMTLRTLVWVGIAAMAWRRSTAHALATREH